MRKYHLLLGLAFFLLLISPVKSATLNFTESALVELPVDTATNYFTWQTKPYFDVSEQQWYYLYELGTSGGASTPYMCIFDSNLTTLVDGCDAQSGTAIYQKGIDFVNENSTHFWEIMNDDGNIEQHFVSKTDLTQTAIQSYSVTANTQTDISATSYKNNTFVFKHNTANQVNFSYSNGTSTQLFVNALHTRPMDLNWVYVPETDEYYLFYVNDTRIFLSIYDASIDDNVYDGWQPNFRGFFNIIPSGDYVYNEENRFGSQFSSNNAKAQGNLYAKYINGFVYWIARIRTAGQGYGNNTLYFEAIDPVGTRDHSWLHLVKGSGEYINLTAYDNQLQESKDNGNYNSSQSISFDFRPDINQWYIFYHRYNRTNAVSSTTSGWGYELMVLKSASECRCSDWVNASSCGKYVSGKQKQIRNCNPDMCDDETQYIDCVEPIPTIKYKLITKCEMCNPATKLDPPQQLYAGEHGSANCQVYVDIPENVTNVTSTAYWSDYWQLCHL